MKEKISQLTEWLLIIFAFAIPISTALTTILLFMLLFLWVLGGDYRLKTLKIRSNPVAIASLIMFGVMMVGLTYGVLDRDALSNSARFIILPVLLSLFINHTNRNAILGAFLSAMVLALVLSYFVWSDVIPTQTIIRQKWLSSRSLGGPDNPFVFQRHIVYSVFMAYAAFCFVVLGKFEERPFRKSLFFLLSLLMMGNILILVQGKTGQVILLILLVYLSWAFLRWRGVIIGTLIIAISVCAVYFIFPKTTFSKWINPVARVIYQWQSAERHEIPSTYNPVIKDNQELSAIYRMEYYYNSCQIILQNPIFGVGTGEFTDAYAKQVSGTRQDRTDNPHNQYLLVGVETGIIGILALLYLLFSQWRFTRMLCDKKRILAQGMLLTIIISCFFNSSLADHAESTFYLLMSALFFSTTEVPIDEKMC
jgi:O-antigen ligase